VISAVLSSLIEAWANSNQSPATGNSTPEAPNQKVKPVVLVHVNVLSYFIHSVERVESKFNCIFAEFKLDIRIIAGIILFARAHTLTRYDFPISKSALIY